MKNKEDGFTVIELLIVIFLFAFIGFMLIGVVSVCAGNYWYSESGVEKELRMDNPNIKVLKSNRNIWRYSRILVEKNSAAEDELKVSRKVICLDTNILWNYKFVSCED